MDKVKLSLSSFLSKRAAFHLHLQLSNAMSSFSWNLAALWIVFLFFVPCTAGNESLPALFWMGWRGEKEKKKIWQGKFLFQIKWKKVEQGSVISSGISWHLSQHWTGGAAAKVAGAQARCVQQFGDKGSNCWPMVWAQVCETRTCSQCPKVGRQRESALVFHTYYGGPLVCIH